MTPELSRPFPLDRLGERACVLVETSEAERAALAHRLGIPKVRALTCRFELSPGEQASVLAAGHLQARVVQVCVVSLEPFESVVEEEFRVRFVPDGAEEAPFDLEADDEIPYAGSALDLGEATAEQLALALDPFPRRPEAAPRIPEEPRRPSPFEALARFRPLRDGGANGGS